MIVLDTNVISEAMKPEPHPKVKAWLNAQAAESLYLSSITLAELQFGIATLTDGKRKTALLQALDGVVALFTGRILSFDQAAAIHYGSLAARARATGKGFPVPDGYIAAIAVSQGFKVATRDMSAFAAANMDVINPWEAK
jgi:predicted nucleic acid-binding protein